MSRRLACFVAALIVAAPAVFAASEGQIPDDLSALPECTAIKATPPRALETSMLPYPEELRHQWIEGSVVLSLVVLPDGAARVERVIGSDPEGLFDEAALAAVATWRFSPAHRDGVPISCRWKLRVRFQLSEEILPGQSRLPSWVSAMTLNFGLRQSISRQAAADPVGAAGVTIVTYRVGATGDAVDVALVSSSLPPSLTARAVDAVRSTQAMMGGELFEGDEMLAIFQLAYGLDDALRLDVWRPRTVQLKPHVAQIVLPVNPDYPEATANAGIGGSVVVAFNVDRSGMVTDERVVFSVPAGTFDESALDAIRNTIHHPAMIAGEPAPSSRHVQSYRFAAQASDSETYPPQRDPLRLAPRWTYDQGVAGQVTIKATLGADGLLGEPRVVRAEPAGVFESCVLQGLKGVRFSPATYEGAPITETVEFVVDVGCSNGCAAPRKIKIPRDPKAQECALAP